MQVKPKIHLLQVEGMPIFEQLRLEEALLRADDKNWCLINNGTLPAIVLGISGKFDEWIDGTALKKAPLQVIRRFSGGGTVVVDEHTLFVTFICDGKILPVPCFAKGVLDWSAGIYHPVFQGCNFQVRENDYAFGSKKVGGNAQYLRKSRFLHHTSFLWDFLPERMSFLSMPPKMPSYRKKRDHCDFLCRMKDFFPSRSAFFKHLTDSLQKQFLVEHLPLEKARSFLSLPHRQSLEMLIK